jgi:hypothetical protein
MPITIDGNGSISGLTATGISAVQKLPAGSVLQVVQNVVVVNNSTTSSSFVTSGVSVSITPTIASSKILIISTGVGYNANNASQSDYTLYRNSTNLAADMMAQIYTSGGSFEGSIAMHFLDSPATTSATTYAVYYKASSGTAYYGFAKTATITAMEIAA